MKETTVNRTDAKKRYRLNFSGLLFEGTFFYMGFTFLDANALVAVFLFTYTGSMELTGLAVTVKTLSFMIAQLAMGPVIARIDNLPRYIRTVMFTARPIILLMVPLLLFNSPAAVIVGVFMACFSILWLSDGMIYVAWLDVFSRVIPGRTRGRLMGWQQITGGIVGILAGFLINFTLDSNLSNNEQFALLFGISGLALTLSASMMLMVKDAPEKKKALIKPYFEWYKHLPSYFMKSKLYRRALLIDFLYRIGAVMLPFIIIYGQTVLNITPDQKSNLLLIQTMGVLFGGFVWGWVSHNKGNKWVMAASHVLGLIIPSALFIAKALSDTINIMVILYPLVVLAGMMVCAWLGYVNYVVDVIDPADRQIYLVLNTVATLPLALLPWLAGWIADSYGFMPILITAIAACILGLIFALSLHNPIHSLSHTEGS